MVVGKMPEKIELFIFWFLLRHTQAVSMVIRRTRGPGLALERS